MQHRFLEKSNQGTITLLLLVLLIMLTLILSASLRLVALQTHQTVDQQHKLQVLDVADAGIQYMTWLLSPTGANKRAADLRLDTSDTMIEHIVSDSDDRPVGAFTLSIPQICSDRVQILSVAHDSNAPELCQSVEAILQQDSSDEYRVKSWEQIVGNACTGVTVSSPLVCPTPTPSPTLTPLPTPT